MRKIKLLILILLMLPVMCGCHHEQTEDINIVYTNDAANVLKGDVGYAGVKYFKDQLQANSSYVTLVDAGDFYDGTISSEGGSIYITNIMNAVGYEIVAVGNQEFSIGLDDLKNNISNANFTFLSCNLKYLGSGNDPLADVKPYVIKKYGWTKVAFIGVTTPETLVPGKAAYNAIVEDGQVLYSFYENEEGEQLYKQVQKTIDSVRKKVDYVIVLAHLGSNSVQPGFSSIDLIANTTGIDVVIDGHSHTPNTGEAFTNKDGESVILTSTGEKLQCVGLLTIHPDHTYNTALYYSAGGKDQEIEAICDSVYEEFGIH